MNKLPFLISLPHSGITVPPEVKHTCLLTPEQIIEDGDEQAAEIYSDLQSRVEGFITSDIARAIIDLNRAPDDFCKDGVIKTHTCWDIPVYSQFPDKTLSKLLLRKYYVPYHDELARLSKEPFCVGIDCHTMAAYGPPVGPDAGVERPLVCLSNAEGATCPDDWLHSLAACLRMAFNTDSIKVNDPFKGGFITRHYGKWLPFIQLELSRTEAISVGDKNKGVQQALQCWFESNPDFHK